ncbi:hypothetical protein AB0J28_16860 [Streptosporangium canum]|uniref:hypothetical protein n=1 Tax=Streptosporangium canum TaxID=324952 RepID=UPI00341700BF
MSGKPVDPMYDGENRPERSGPTPDSDVFCGYIGEVVRDLDPTTEADPVSVLATLLTASGVMMGRNPHVQIGDDRHPALIWSMIIGKTNSGRKGASKGTAMRIITAADPEFAGAPFQISGLSSGEGLIEDVKDDDEDPHKDKRRLVMEMEFSSTMARSAREGNSLPAVLRLAWDSENLSVLTKKKLTATNAHIGLVAHIPPREFRLRLSDREMAGGTYNRFMPFYSHRNILLPLPTGARSDLVLSHGQELRKRIDKARTYSLIGMSAAAEKLWREEYYEELSSDGEDGPLAEFTARGAAYCRRLAMVYALLDNSPVIEEHHLRAGYCLVNYSHASASYVLGTSTGNPDLDKLAAAVRNAGAAGLRKTDVTKLFSHFNRSQRADLIKDLMEFPGFEQEEVKTAGRPATVLIFTDPGEET